MRRRKPERARQEREYLRLRRGFLEDNPQCARCGYWSEQVHHKQGRVGLLLTDVSKWLAVCAECHRVITENPAWALREGWSLSRVAGGDAA